MSEVCSDPAAVEVELIGLEPGRCGLTDDALAALGELLDVPVFAPQPKALLEDFAASVGRSVDLDLDPAVSVAKAESGLRSLARGWAYTELGTAVLFVAVELILDALRQPSEAIGQPGLDPNGRRAASSTLRTPLAKRTAWMRLLRDSHHAEQAAIRARRETAGTRYGAVLQILEGASTPARELGYDLREHHLAMIIDDQAGALDAIAATLSGSPLAVCAPEAASWIWVRSPSAPDPTVLEKLATRLQELELHAGVGSSARGLEGFRKSHREALQARSIALAWDATVIRYEDLSLLELTGLDPARARAFVERELAPLLHGGPAVQKLIRTLHTYLTHGQRLGVTASICGLHRDTIRNQLSHAEQLLGRQLGWRSGELLVALRLHLMTAPHTGQDARIGKVPPDVRHIDD